MLLQIIWKQIEDAKRTEIVKELTAELPPHDQTKYSLSLAQQLSFEERSSLVERILRAFSAYEMASFVDFLPYIWEDLSVQHANKLLSRMTHADRKRILDKLRKDEEEAALAAAAAAAPSVAAAAAAAEQARKKRMRDPAQLSPDELPGWGSLVLSSNSIGARCRRDTARTPERALLVGWF